VQDVSLGQNSYRITLANVDPIIDSYLLAVTASLKGRLGRVVKGLRFLVSQESFSEPCIFFPQPGTFGLGIFQLATQIGFVVHLLSHALRGLCDSSATDSEKANELDSCCRSINQFNNAPTEAATPQSAAERRPELRYNSVVDSRI